MITIIGRHGFLGSALEKRLGKHNEITSYPTKKTRFLLHFGSPVHPPFEENPDYHMTEIIQSFLHLLPYCRDNDIKFIYPSSALVYEKETDFTRCKKIMELLASCYPNTLGLRIFPVYGPGENRTIVSQWCDAMKGELRPEVYGDGSQWRDFVYIDDAVEQIITLANSKATGIRDIATDFVPTTFNDIIKLINDELGTKLKPKYIKAPKGYSDGIGSKKPGKCSIMIDEGIRRICQKI